MSHWQTGEVELLCSLNELEEMLVDMVPSWDGSIYTSEEGDLSVYNYIGKKGAGSYNLVVPGVKNPQLKAAKGMTYSDLGMRRRENGTWFIKMDVSGLPNEIRDFEKRLKATLGVMKVKNIAHKGRNKETADCIKDGKRCIRLITPVEEKHRVIA